MRIAISSWSFRFGTIDQALASISSLGVRYVELFANKFHLDPRRGKISVRYLAAVLERCALTPISLHMPFAGFRSQEGTLSSTRAWLDLVDECLKLVIGLEIPKIVLHPQIQVVDEEGRQKGLDIVDSLEEIHAKLSTSKTWILVENLHPLLFGGYCSYREFTKVLKRAEGWNIGMCFDTSHCLCSGLDALNEVVNCMEWIKEIHLSDNLPEPKMDRHLPLSLGTLDWTAFFALLEREGFEGDLVLEVDGGKEPFRGVSSSLDFLRGIVGHRESR